MKIAELESNFSSSPKYYSPFVRWWWFGCNITQEELAYELKEISEKGFGGVEIQSIYAPFKKDKKKNDEIIQFLSQKWLELVGFTVEYAKKLNLIVDMTFGNGWPFGGPYIPKEMASSKLECFKVHCVGHKLLTKGILKYFFQPNEIIALIAVPRKKYLGQKDITNKSFIDLTTHIKNGKLDWKIPSGKWEILGFFNGKTKQKVKRAAPGGEGFVLDHLNREAFKIHSDNFGGKLIDKFGSDLGKVFNAFFCDSWEVYHENWTRNFLRKFIEYKGYDLTSYLPLLSITSRFKRLKQKITNNDEIIRCNYDYREVHAKLIKEEFFRPFVDYCHSVNVKARVQPYVAPTDLLEIYGLLDILEIEGFGKYGIGTTYYGGVDPRLTSSAAHVYQKNMVSCESFTWLGEHFSVSLEQLKKEADQIILHGINYVIYHGYPYSPRNEGNPGWVFYASVLANHNNTWWSYIHELNVYISRCSLILRNSINVADWAVYLPYHDEWSDKPGILKRLRLALRESGHFTDFDYVNDERLLNAAKIEIDKLIVGNGTYKGLILWNVEFLPLRIAERILELVNQGMNLVLIGNIPHNSPGLKALQQNEPEQVKAIFDSIMLRASHSNQSSNNIFYWRSLEGLDNFYKSKSIEPDFTIILSDNKKTPVNNVKYLHQKCDDADFYFIVNENDEPIDIEINLREKGSLETWDPIDGLILPIVDKNPIKLHLDKIESKWIVVKKYDSSNGDLSIKTEQNEYAKEPIKEIILNEGWKISFRWSKNAYPLENSKELIIENSKLFNWTSNTQTRYFSGTATYEISVELSDHDIEKSNKIILDLGDVHEIASISINGKFIRSLWFGHKILDIKPYIQSGKNHLQIQVTNLLLNKIIGYDRKRIKWRRDYYLVNQYYLPFKPRFMKLLPSGLLGPVKLRCY